MQHTRSRSSDFHRSLLTTHHPYHAPSQLPPRHHPHRRNCSSSAAPHPRRRRNAPVNAPLDPSAIQPFVTAPGTATFIWPVATLSTGFVEYGPTPALGKIAEGSRDGLRPIDDTALAIPIKNLRPGERIHFRAITAPLDFPSHYDIRRGDPIASPIFEYTHPGPSRDARIAVWNDTHQQPATLAALGRATAAFAPGLLVLNGDLVQDQFNTPRDLAETFFNLHPAPGNPQSPALIPRLFVRGNHDARGRHARDLPRLAPRPSPGGYQTLLRAGPVGIIVLDTGDDKESPGVYGGLGDFAAYRERQKRWLAAALAHPGFATAPYRIVFCHIPLSWKQPGRLGEWCPDGDARWSPLLAGAKIHAIISGHTHEHWHEAPRPGSPWHQVVSGGPEITSTKWYPTPACLVTLEANPASLVIRTTEAASGKTHLSLTINPN